MTQFETLQTKEFARRAGVTVRTLHHYDRLGLLPPSGRAASGYRLYGEREFLRLQQISILKFIGCPLQQIKDVLDHNPPNWQETLRMQEEALERRRSTLDQALAAVQRAQSRLADSGQVDWDALKQIVEAIEMEQNMEWTKKYFTPEQQTELARRREQDPKQAERGQRAWAELLPKVEEAVRQGVDPNSRQAKELAQSWSDLVRAFTGGDAEMTRSLSNLYADHRNWPKETSFQRPWSDEADVFIKTAMRAHAISCA